MRISDWSVAVCSSDLGAHALGYRQALSLATAATLAGSLASLTATFLLSLLDYPVSRRVGQRIARAAAAAGIPHQDIASDQVGDIAQRRVGRGLGQIGRAHV